MDHFYNDLLAIWKEKVLKYHINKLYHFGNITTLQTKSEHAKIQC